MVEHVARMERVKATDTILVNLKRRNHLEDLGIDGKKLLKFTLKSVGKY
jgi:hypothetical protein